MTDQSNHTRFHFTVSVPKTPAKTNMKFQELILPFVGAAAVSALLGAGVAVTVSNSQQSDQIADTVAVQESAMMSFVDGNRVSCPLFLWTSLPCELELTVRSLVSLSLPLPTKAGKAAKSSQAKSAESGVTKSGEAIPPQEVEELLAIQLLILSQGRSAQEIAATTVSASFDTICTHPIVRTV